MAVLLFLKGMSAAGLAGKRIHKSFIWGIKIQHL